MPPGAKEKEGQQFGLRRAGRQFAWRWKSRSVVNKCLLGHLTMWHTEDLDQTGLASSCLSTTLAHTKRWSSMTLSPFLGQILCLNSLRQLEREVKGYFRVFCFLEITSLKQLSQRHKIGDGKCCSSSVFPVIRPFLISHHIYWRKVVPNICRLSFNVCQICSDRPSSIPNASNLFSLSFVISLTRHLSNSLLFYK